MELRFGRGGRGAANLGTVTEPASSAMRVGVHIATCGHAAKLAANTLICENETARRSPPTRKSEETPDERDGVRLRYRRRRGGRMRIGGAPVGRPRNQRLPSGGGRARQERVYSRAAGLRRCRPHRAERGALRDRAASAAQRPMWVSAARPRDRRQHVGQRDGLHPRPGRGL